VQEGACCGREGACSARASSCVSHTSDAVLCLSCRNACSSLTREYRGNRSPVVYSLDRHTYTRLHTCRQAEGLMLEVACCAGG
jgi:hypothetical protein